MSNENLMVILIVAELMLLGFISLLLTVGQSPISRMCISEKVADSWHPCSKEEENNTDSSVSDEESEPESSGRRLLAAFVGSGREIPRRVLAGGGGSDKCGEVSMILLYYMLSSYTKFDFFFGI